LRIEVTNDWPRSPNYAERALSMLSAASRRRLLCRHSVVDTMGLHSFQALTAPIS